MLAQRVQHAQLVAGQLEIDVDFNSREPLGGQMGQPLLERVRFAPRGVAVVVGEGRTSNSIMSTPASSAASKLSNVFPGAIRSAPL
jgi:hypothetical protein